VASELRAGLGARKPHRPHPASPEAVDDRIQRASEAPSAQQGGGEVTLVMLCVRVAPSLRRRLKLAAASSGCSVQALAADALEAICRQHDM
jgi:hypothetical protein